MASAFVRARRDRCSAIRRRRPARPAGRRGPGSANPVDRDVVAALPRCHRRPPMYKHGRASSSSGSGSRRSCPMREPPRCSRYMPSTPIVARTRRRCHRDDDRSRCVVDQEVGTGGARWTRRSRWPRRRRPVPAARPRGGNRVDRRLFGRAVRPANQWSMGICDATVYWGPGRDRTRQSCRLAGDAPAPAVQPESRQQPEHSEERHGPCASMLTTPAVGPRTSPAPDHGRAVTLRRPGTPPVGPGRGAGSIDPVSIGWWASADRWTPGRSRTGCCGRC